MYMYMYICIYICICLCIYLYLKIISAMGLYCPKLQFVVCVPIFVNKKSKKNFSPSNRAWYSYQYIHMVYVYTFLHRWYMYMCIKVC